jgi:hypothetical protein
LHKPKVIIRDAVDARLSTLGSAPCSRFSARAEERISEQFPKSSVKLGVVVTPIWRRFRI